MTLLAITCSEKLVDLIMELDEFAVYYVIVGVYFVFGRPCKVGA